jgi:hypothetical protein
LEEEVIAVLILGAVFAVLATFALGCRVAIAVIERRELRQGALPRAELRR